MEMAVQFELRQNPAVVLHAGLDVGFTYPDVARQGLVVFEPSTEDPDEDPDFPAVGGSSYAPGLNTYPETLVDGSSVKSSWIDILICQPSSSP